MYEDIQTQDKTTMPSLNLRRLSSNSSEPSNHSKKVGGGRSFNHGSTTSGGSEDTATVSRDPSEEEGLSQDTNSQGDNNNNNNNNNEPEQPASNDGSILQIPSMIKESQSLVDQSVHSTASNSEEETEQKTGPLEQQEQQQEGQTANQAVEVEIDEPSWDVALKQQSHSPDDDEISNSVPMAPDEIPSIPQHASHEDEKTDEEGPLLHRDRMDSQQRLRSSKSPSSLPRTGSRDSHGGTNSSWDMESDHARGDPTTRSTSFECIPCCNYTTTNTNTNNNKNPKILSKSLSLAGRRAIEFSHVHIREYNVCIGDNPCCGYGPPLALDWEYFDPGHDIPLDIYEQHYQLPRQAMYGRSRRTLVLSYTERRARLWRAGYSLEEIDEVTEKLERAKWRRSLLGNLEPFYKLQELWVLYGKPMLFKKSRMRRELDQQLDYVEQLVREEHHSQHGSREFSRDDTSQREVDLEAEMNYVRKESKEVYKEIAAQLEVEKAEQSPNDHHDYGIRIDKKEHDKATEIILCSMRRPHMRAFHASWFSFFVAFYTWFAITPLLSEVQETLQLSKADVWISSLFGTAGTIVFRILTGPACDIWGARIVMSVILVMAAIPTAMTGFVQTSMGLWLVRLFIGIGGSSFVACQYWTSAMFSRATAGTANALVAGWGNLGGGVTNLLMGSVFFPLFRWFYRGEDVGADDDDVSTDLAWRTVFVIPAALSILTALLIVCFCDDSPTGSYRDRIKSEKLLVADPKESIKHAAKNWNVWILAIQYSCCFGVEVTMTNATALYFKDEFGQTTVSAAAIASTFGFMNLFARGLGGYCSDKLQNRFHVQGRLFWQIFTLTLEGVGVGMFALADTLAGSIAALIFLSCMVQSAEGSTFGIVPYVSRRYTGAVVGIVGSGGNAGAAIFSVFFVCFSYKSAFILMGLSAIGSAFLSFFIKTEKLEKTYEDVAVEVEQRERDQAKSDDGGDLPGLDEAGLESNDLEIELSDDFKQERSSGVDFEV